MTDWGLVLDASSSRVTREDFRRLKEGMGVRGYIQCLQTGGFSASQAQVRAVAEPNMSDAVAEGYAVGGYLNSQPWRPAQVIHDDAISVAGAAWSGLAMVANDMEIDGITEAHCLAAQQLLDAAGKRAPAYTAWWFASRFGGMHWTWIPARWDADYDGRPQDIDVRWGPANAPVVGKQYAGTTNLGGDLFDLNFFDLDYLRPAASPAEEDDMFEQQDRDALDRIRRYLFDPASLSPAGTPPATTEDIYAQLKAIRQRLDALDGGGGASADAVIDRLKERL